MASFSRNVDDVKLKTYEDVAMLHNLLSAASMKLGLVEPRIKTKVQFYIGEISCMCESYEEFVENAYGTENFKLIAVDVHIYDRSNSVIYVGYIGMGRVSASADSRAMLEKFLMQLQKEQNAIKNGDQAVTQNIVDSVVITGNGNTVANNGGNIMSVEKKKENRMRDFFSGILQNIASNLIWYLITFVAGILLAYLTTR